MLKCTHLTVLFQVNHSGREARDDGGIGWTIIMLIICSLLQTDNHARTSSLNFYGLDGLPEAQPAACIQLMNTANNSDHLCTESMVSI